MPYLDPEKKRQNSREYYLKNKAKIIKRAFEWNKKYTEARKAIVKRNNVKRAVAKRIWWEQKHFGGFSKEGKVCFICAEDRQDKLNIHHKDGNNGRLGKPLNNNANNLVVVCDSCHPKLHGKWGVRKSFKDKWTI